MLDFKKEKLTQAHYAINQLLGIVAKRLVIPLQELVFAHREELSKLLNGRMDVSILHDRSKKSSYYFSSRGMCIFTGKTVNLLQRFLEGKKKGFIREISGICANPGTLLGRVKVLRGTHEIGKIRKGDIIVTGMTTPEYVIAMRKAAAIITNEGGVTCHAAIVSRELGIPCIVGTKNATHMLKDGDLVELHAGNGVIKILKKHEKSL